MKIKISLVIAFLMGVLLWSCGGNAVIQRNFIIDYDNSTNQENSVSLDCSGLQYNVRINRFEISRAYNQERIALRTKSNEVIYYYYNKWAENPVSAVRHFILEKFKINNIFAGINLNEIETMPDFVINGVISQIERIDIENTHAAHVKMILEFTEANSGKILVLHEFDRSAEIKKNASMNTFAREISRILDEECNVFINRICSKLNENK
ncbi:MAG: ABC-type transport auxiliary lipoprotein family protein [Calditrichaceae bacterium]